MNAHRQTLPGRFIPGIFLFLSISGCDQQQFRPSEVLIDSVAEIVLHTSCGDIKIKAKFDSGADGSSIDRRFAEKLCVNEPFIGDTKNTHCENGMAWADGECRNRVVLEFTAKDVYVKGRATISNKTDDRYPVLIGNRETKGVFVIRPVYETTTENWSLDQYEIEAEEEEEN